MLYFIDPTPEFMGPNGKPDHRLFRMDRLHPNYEGYALLAQSIWQPLLAAPANNR
jgi:lysophospholipase L1-like esterase